MQALVYKLWVLLILLVISLLAGYAGYYPLQTSRQEHQVPSVNLGWEKGVVPAYSNFGNDDVR
jgi:hypothetical protein